MAEHTLRRGQLAGNADTDWLKLVALVFMMIDHLGVALFGNAAEMRMLGRIAMPVYAWCLVVGCVYTRDMKRYALRLLTMAVISQPINMIALGNTWGKLNILFLFTLAVLVIYGIRMRWHLSHIWAPVLGFALLGFLNVDYGWRGLAFILLLYMARSTPAGLAALFLAYSAFWGAGYSAINSIAGVPLTFLGWPGVGAVVSLFFRMQGLMVLALPLILIPTHMGIKLPKWVGYGFYPLHLLLIFALRVLGGADAGQLLAVLGKW